ncbi:MAG: tRNA (cytidine(56)-2'-O)-methyltransferase [Candidatus Njordarchaeales archaeon]
MPEIWVLRLGHRKSRDKRVSTHVGLVARAFGANGIIFSGEYDNQLLESLKKVVEKWGGPFQIIHEQNWKRVIKEKKNLGYLIVHLTMYGLNLPMIINEIRHKFYEERKNLLVIIGAEKVPGVVYELADYNVAIGNQPHSEVAALAVFLDWLFKGRELEKEFKNAKLKIIPCKKGKKILKLSDNL